MAEDASRTLLKRLFNHSSRRLRYCKDSLLSLEEDIAKLNEKPQNILTNLGRESQLDLKRHFESTIEECRAQLVSIYKMAIEEDFDVDGSRLLAVYRFFYRNRAQLHRHLALIDVPRGSNAVWGIIILTAIMYLYAAV